MSWHRTRLLLLLTALSPRAALAGDVNFARDIRPILANHCYDCHGPDENRRRAGLRLDTQDGWAAKLESGKPLAVAGKREQSELWRRINSADDKLRMPAAESKKRLTRGQIELIGRWIDAGAKWSPHWAYVSPVRPKLPAEKFAGWSAGAIDRFVAGSMAEHGLAPSRPATKEDQLRRVTFDLTGLPPTLAEVNAFVADHRADAYQRVVDRLLTSPRHGERMAQDWLDLARYADTHGYHSDAQRDMWRWRDWVIEALNTNMPLDQFTVEQLAGDLLPNATLSQRIATGFNRNHMINHENGAIAEEYRTEYVIDRVVTTGTVWLGQTWACARCHDHKYDPITQRDFYRMFAYFNNVAENGLDGREGNAIPQIAAPTDEQRQQLARLDQQLASLQAALTKRAAACDQDLAAWLKQEAQQESSRLPPGNVAAHFSLEETPAAKIQGNQTFVTGKFGQALLFDGETSVELGDALTLDRDRPATLSLWFFATSDQPGTLLARVDDAFDWRGFVLGWENRRLVARLRSEARSSELAVRTTDQLPLRKWRQVVVAADGSGKASGLQIFVDGNAVALEVLSDTLTSSIATQQPWQLGKRHKDEPWRGMIDEVRLYARLLSRQDIALLAGGDPLREILAKQASEQTAQEREQIKRYYLEHHDETYCKLQAELLTTNKERERVQRLVPTTMVMQELETPHETFILEGGLYNKPQEKVTAGVPDFVRVPASAGRLTAELQQSRLGLAHWLVDRRHPLTARVFVNRYWSHFFGRGLVATPEDFGARGAPPSHPELLDYLAVELMESGWNVKHVLQLIVTSNTYRQSAYRTQPPHPGPLPKGEREQDEQNVWLSRGPSVRLSAEAIRDRALAASGLLCEQIGGPSVNPYQPADLWKDLAYDVTTHSAQTFQMGRGSDLYRRSLYTFWKRTAPHPLLAAFDAPNRETCTAERPRTNSPLQALAMLNDETMLEAARSLARQAQTSATQADEARVDFIFHTALSRRPEKRERERLLQLFREQLEHFAADREAASVLAADDSQQASALAAWTTVAQVVFNLDEFVVK